MREPKVAGQFSVSVLLLEDAVGETVPIPTLPLESIRIASAPPSEKAMVSAAGKKMPVLASVPRIAGAAAVPSTSERPFVPSRIKLIYSFYKTTQRLSVGTVTIAPLEIEIGPVDMAFLPVVIV